ncbi:MAG: DUF4012 domain-containing protein [Methanobacteriaceae archaeon]|nr:DUF4012 domain-containing protein [Methanobacteriaceae archaeon]
MERKKKLIYAILIILLIGFIAMVISSIFFNNGADLLQGNKNVLVCAVDESEKRPGMGAIDMAYIINLKDGEIIHYDPLYPAGLTHPNVSEPQEAQAQGAGSKLLLHDALWSSNARQGALYAKEIVEYNTNVSINAVVLVNSKGINSLITAASPLEFNGTTLNVSAQDIIGEENNQYGASKGDSILTTVTALGKASNNPIKKPKLLSTAFTEYTKGNIVVYPIGSFIKLMFDEEIQSLI